MFDKWGRNKWVVPAKFGWYDFKGDLDIMIRDQWCWQRQERASLRATVSKELVSGRATVLLFARQKDFMVAIAGVSVADVSALNIAKCCCYYYMRSSFPL
ncbi:hypothetical protein ACH5RR_036423 [Cinchona calisaya]|uniref:Uncharacterized protein n=1 Tax=Cinchona calisaya TaxID=153742 RepID=A0ABD2Y364_9GENT